MSDKLLLRLPEVLEITGFGKTTIYAWIAEGTFPKPIKIGRATCWKFEDVKNWVEGLKD